MGDATNSVMILAGEMLKKAENLLIMGLHPSEIIKGYELASAKALSELESTHLPLSFPDRVSLTVQNSSFAIITTLTPHQVLSRHRTQARNRLKTIRLRGPTCKPRRGGLLGRYAAKSQKLQCRQRACCEDHGGKPWW